MAGSGKNKRAKGEVKTETRDSAATCARLLGAAKSLFSKKGFDGVSVKELAEAAGVNISLISYHFDGKEGLYRTCLELFGKERLAVAQRMLQPATTIEELSFRLKMYAEELLACHIEQPELTQMIHREVELEMPVAQDIFRDTFFAGFRTLVDFIAAAQKRKLLSSACDPLLTASFIQGTLLHSCRSERIGKKLIGVSIRDLSFRNRIVEHTVHTILYGWVTDKEGSRP